MTSWSALGPGVSGLPGSPVIRLSSTSRKRVRVMTFGASLRWQTTQGVLQFFIKIEAGILQQAISVKHGSIGEGGRI